MHGSSILPWLLIGPVLVATIGKILANLTELVWLDTISKAALVVALVVIAIAIAGSIYSNRALSQAAKVEKRDE